MDEMEGKKGWKELKDGLKRRKYGVKERNCKRTERKKNGED